MKIFKTIVSVLLIILGCINTGIFLLFSLIGKFICGNFFEPQLFLKNKGRYKVEISDTQELLIRYENEELFEGLYHFPVLSEDDAFNVALNIKDYKNRIFGSNEETDFPYEIVD